MNYNDSIESGKMARFDTRLPMQQKQLFEQAALLGGYRTLTEFVLAAVQERARQIISEREAFLVTEQDKAVFFEAMLNPAEPNEALVKAAQHYAQKVNNGLSDRPA